MFINAKYKIFSYFRLIVIVVVTGCASSNNIPEKQDILTELEESLKKNLLETWYPLSLDTLNGGFLSDFTFDWRPYGPQNKMLVTQTRHIWTTSQAAMFYNDEQYQKIAEHGFKFLRKNMWDKTYGGFYTLRNREGDFTSEEYGDSKSAYGNAFAIYSLVSYYVLTKDTAVLDLAKKTFLWLEKHSHDPDHNGYFDRLLRDGSMAYENRAKSNNPDAFRWKDYNSSIHLLEAFTQLYKVWKNDLVGQRLQEMSSLVRDTIVTEKGYLNLYFESNWKPISYQDSSNEIQKKNSYYDHVSFGHDLETAYLLLEASHAIGIKSDRKTLDVAKKLVDHAFSNGWDSDNGGFYYQGYYYKNSDNIKIINKVKTWWVQAEGLNTLLLMSKLFPDQADYEKSFKKQWEYINKYLIDHQHGGWYEEGLDYSPDQVKKPKARDWKVNYHNIRGLMNCIKILRSEFELLNN